MKTARATAAKGKGVSLARRLRWPRSAAQKTAAVAARAAAAEAPPRDLAAQPLAPGREGPWRKKITACARENTRAAAAQGVSLTSRLRRLRRLGVDPTDETSDAKAEFAAEKVEITLGGKNGRIKGSLGTEECHPRRDAPKNEQF